MKQDCLPIEGVNYSTSEKVVGTWIDGKKIYQKTLTANNITNIGTCVFEHGISNFGELIDHTMPTWYDSSDNCWRSGFRLGSNYSIGMGSISANSTTVYLNNDSFSMNTIDWSTRTNSVRVTIWYIKTTD